MRKTKRLMSLLITIIMVFSMFCIVPINVSAANGIDSKIDAMLKLFPSGSYFTQNGSACSHAAKYSCDNCYLPNILKRSDLSGLGYVKDTDYTGSWTCVAFANFAFRYIYGKKFSTSNYSQVASGSFSQSTLSVAKKGDIIGFYNSSGDFQHYAVYMGTSTSSNATFYQANFGGVPKVNYGTWTYANMNSYYGGGSMKVFRANNYSSVSGHTCTYDTFAYYGASHPHYSYYKCSCGALNVDTTKTGASDGCSQCVPGTPTLTVIPGSSVEYTQLRWDETVNTDYYGVNIYNADTDERIYFMSNINYLNHQVKLEPGRYYANATACSNALKLVTDYHYRISNVVNFTVEESEFALANSIEGEESRYELYDIAMPWTEAKAKCEEFGGHLAVINSQEEQNLIEELLSGGNRGAYWLGITDEETEGVWKAVTNEDVAYYNWMTAELPDNNKNEDYVAIYTVNFGWNDIANTYGGYLGFICEYPNTVPDGLEYEIADGEVTITDYTGSATELDIPSTIEGYSVTAIGENAFFFNSSLESITIPESVTNIADYAFAWTSKLTNITIPESVTSIGVGIFGHCTKLENITVNENNTVYDSRSNCNAIIETATNTLLAGCSTTVIPDDVEAIGDYAFYYCSSLKNITIPENVKSIGASAFEGCTSLESIIIPEGVTKIAPNTLRECNSLREVTIPVSVTSIESYAFYCTVLFNDVEDYSVTAESEEYYCTHLTDIYYGGTQAQWDAIAIANNNNDLKNATIHVVEPEVETHNVTFVDWDGTVLSTQTVEQGASAEEPEIPYRDGYEFTGWDTDFSNVQSDLVVTATYTYLTLVSGDYEYTVTDGEVTITAYTGTATNLVVPEYIDGYPVTQIGNDAFAYCQTLVGVELPSTLTEIGQNAFKYCKGLAGIKVPEGVTTIGKNAFYGCTALTGITIPSTVTRIGDEAFIYCEGLVSVEISEGVETIGSYAFRGCLELTTITIPKSVTSVEERAFYGCSALDDVYYSGTSAQWAGISIADYNEPLTAATLHYNSKNIPLGLEYSIADGAVIITGYTGSNAILDIPQTIEGYPVTAIGTNAFDSLTNLLVVELPSTVTSIGEGAFKYCKGITGIELPEGITEISDNAFYGCTSLVDITIPDSVERIGSQAFIYCEALESITIPASVTDIGDFAFRGCVVLRNVEISEGLKNIGASAFRGCSVLREISLPKSVQNIGDKAFYACSKLADVYYGGSELRWSDVSVAQGNDTLTSATIHYALSSDDEIFTVTFVDFDGTVLDTQTVEYGNSATAPSDPARDGYTFKGWDTDFSSITEDTTVTAQYTRIAPKGTLRIEVTGGTGFSISINGSNPRPQGSVYRNSKIEIGATVTVTARETAGATFVGWMNPVSGVILSSEVDYTFVASGNDSINAVFNTQIEGVQVVSFKNDKANRILDSQYYSAEDTIEFPDAPTQVGFDFAGWSMTEDEIKSAIANGQDVEVLANWTRQIVPVQVTVNGGTGTGSYDANSAVTVTANEAPEGEKFAYWTDAQGNIKSYSTEYKFYPTADTTLTAVFVAEDEAIDYQILVNVDSIDTTTIADKNVFYYSWYCPEEYTFVKAGLLAVNKDNYNESTFVAGSSDSNVYDRSPSGANLKPVNTYSWSKSNVTSGQTWMAKAYVQYKHAEGAIITVYSDVIEATKE